MAYLLNVPSYLPCDFTNTDRKTITKKKKKKRKGFIFVNRTQVLTLKFLFLAADHCRLFFCSVLWS